MAIVRIPDENRTLREQSEITAYLSGIGIDYQRWDLPEAVADGATEQEILTVYREQIHKLKQRGGYVIADVIDVTPQTPNLEAMLEKFSREHWHEEDEVRFIVRGRGLFHIHPRQGRLTAIEVEAGDLIRVPRGTWHWFDLCGDRTIRAIRLFQDQSGWAPHYTDSGVDRNYQPVCMGPSYFPTRPAIRS
jgi:1,2-dihydroxy-3-keto-5-methylthiopentene dioxygenase